MDERIKQELELLSRKYADLEYQEDGSWIRIPSHPLPEGWNRAITDVAFQVKAGYPGVSPYGIYVPTGLLFNQNKPDSYTEPAPTQPPFPGTWSILSWQADGEWRATTDLINGSNLLNWVIGFAERFREGK